MLIDSIPLEWLVYYLLGVNFIAFAAFGLDKMRAKAGAWRISEGALLGWALIGGTPGAYTGRQTFRHKTRKQPFSGQLHGIAVLQVAILGFGSAVGWDKFFALLEGMTS